jgi:hypothetical protein
MAHQPADNGWQMFLIPLLHESKPEHLRLFIRPDDHHGSGSGEDAGEKGTRFIVEITFSQLGPMQMDGLVRKKPDSTHFDLMIRTDSLLPAGVQNDIRQIFEASAEITGFYGAVQFQQGDFTTQHLEDLTQAPLMPEITA